MSTPLENTRESPRAGERANHAPPAIAARRLGPGPAILRRGFLAPRYWAAWLGLLLIRLLACLPYRERLTAGRLVGRAMRAALPGRRRIARINLERCFPEVGDHDALERAHFRAWGIAAVELGVVWWRRREALSPLARVVGREHLDAALARGKGAILLSAHLASMETGVAHLALGTPCNVVYRPHANRLVDAMIREGRNRFPGHMIDRKALRSMLAALGRNEVIWYSPDQDFGRRRSVFVPLFGMAAATTTATGRLARLSGAPVLPFYTGRLPGARGYEIVFGAPIPDFPSADDVRDAAQVNAVLEEAIRRDVPQYFWLHRRFKTRPEPGEDFYAR